MRAARWFSPLIAIVLALFMAYQAPRAGGATAAMTAFVIGVAFIVAFELVTQPDWFHPRVIVLSMLALYALPFPALTLAAPAMRMAVTPDQIAWSCFVIVFAFLGVLVGDVMPLPAIGRRVLGRLRISDSIIRASFVVFVCAVLPIFVLEFLRLRGSGYFDLGRSERVGYASIHGIGLFTPAFSGLVLFCLFSMGPMFKGSPLRVYQVARYGLVALVVLLAVLAVGWIESRYMLAVLMIGTLIVIHFQFRRLRKSMVAIFCAAALTLLVVMAFTRANYQIGQMAVSEMFSPDRHGEVRELHESTIYAHEYVQENQPLYGATYWNSYRIVLPRFLVQRPAELEADDADQLIRVDPSLWYSASKSMDRFTQGHHFGFSSTAEAYLNFGVIGPFVVFSGFVIVLRTLYVRAATSCFDTGIYAVIAASTFWFIRSPIAYFAKDMLMFFVIPLYGLSMLLVLCLPLLRSERPRELTTVFMGAESGS